MISFEILSPSIPISVDVDTAFHEYFDSDGYVPHVVIMYAAELLEQAGFGFRVAGVGIDEQYLCVDTDLSCVMEDLDALLASIIAREVCEMWFYPDSNLRLKISPLSRDVIVQPVSVKILGSPGGGEASESRVDVGSTWIGTLSELLDTLIGLRYDFARNAVRIDPRLAGIDPIRSWLV